MIFSLVNIQLPQQHESCHMDKRALRLCQKNGWLFNWVLENANRLAKKYIFLILNSIFTWDKGKTRTLIKQRLHKPHFCYSASSVFSTNTETPFLPSEPNPPLRPRRHLVSSHILTYDVKYSKSSHFNLFSRFIFPLILFYIIICLNMQHACKA